MAWLARSRRRSGQRWTGLTLDFPLEAVGPRAKAFGHDILLARYVFLDSSSDRCFRGGSLLPGAGRSDPTSDPRAPSRPRAHGQRADRCSRAATAARLHTSRLSSALRIRGDRTQRQGDRLPARPGRPRRHPGSGASGNVPRRRATRNLHPDRTRLGVIEERRSATQADPAGEHAAMPTAQPSGDWWAAPAAAMLVVVCCAAPLLLGVLLASGAGGWLAAHGFVLGTAVVVVVAAVLAVGAWMRVRRDEPAR